MWGDIRMGINTNINNIVCSLILKSVIEKTSEAIRIPVLKIISNRMQFDNPLAASTDLSNLYRHPEDLSVTDSDLADQTNNMHAFNIIADNFGEILNHLPTKSHRKMFATYLHKEVVLLS